MEHYLAVGVELLNECNLDCIARPMETAFAVHAPKEWNLIPSEKLFGSLTPSRVLKSS